MAVEVQGLKELADALRALPTELASKSGGPLAKGLRAAGYVIRDDAKRRAPVLAEPAKYRKAGTLKNAIKVRRDRIQAPGAVETFEVYVQKAKGGKRGTYSPDDPYYWRFVEFGTGERHKKSGASSGRVIARPFLRPAFEAKKEEALRTFEAELAKAIDKANRKVLG